MHIIFIQNVMQSANGNGNGYANGNGNGFGFCYVYVHGNSALRIASSSKELPCT